MCEGRCSQRFSFDQTLQVRGMRVSRTTPCWMRRSFSPKKILQPFFAHSAEPQTTTTKIARSPQAGNWHFADIVQPRLCQTKAFINRRIGSLGQPPNCPPNIGRCGKVPSLAISPQTGATIPNQPSRFPPAHAENRDTEIRLGALIREHGTTGCRRSARVFGKPDFVFAHGEAHGVCGQLLLARLPAPRNDVREKPRLSESHTHAQRVARPRGARVGVCHGAHRSRPWMRVNRRAARACHFTARR